MNKEGYYSKINSLCSYWGNRDFNDPIPSEYKVNGKRIKKLISDFVKDLGEFNERKQLYTYNVKGRPAFSRKAKFAYPMTYPSIGVKDVSYSKRLKVKSIVYKPQSNELMFVFPSKRNVLNTKTVKFEDIAPQLQIYGREYGKYIEMLDFMRDVVYNHEIPQGLYLHVHGVNGTPDSIVLMN